MEEIREDIKMRLVGLGNTARIFDRLCSKIIPDIDEECKLFRHLLLHVIYWLHFPKEASKSKPLLVE